MANIKSAKKRVLTSRVRQERNKAIKSSIKTASKKVLAAAEASDKELAQKELDQPVKRFLESAPPVLP